MPACQRSELNVRPELDELEPELPPPLLPPPPLPPLPDDPPLSSGTVDDELELLDEDVLDEDALDEEAPLDEDEVLDEAPLDDEVLELLLDVDEFVLAVDVACAEPLPPADWPALDETIGFDTLVGSVMPTQAVAIATGALTSSSRKLRRAASVG